jgi:preprotein translocase subunit YajC
MAAPTQEPEEDYAVRPESLLLLVLMGGLLFMMFSRSRRQQREAAQLQSRLAPGSRVMTTAGLYATVVAIEGDAIVLETGPGQTSRWDRRAVSRVLPEEVAEPIAGADEDETDSMSEESEGAAGSSASTQEAAPPDRA